MHTWILALVFAVLLGLEWRYRRRSLRLGTVALALMVLWLAQPQPNITVAARRASAAPPEARIRVYGKDTLSAFMSGVDLMREYVSDQYTWDAERALALGTLAWLAASPAFRRERMLSQTPQRP